MAHDQAMQGAMVSCFMIGVFACFFFALSETKFFRGLLGTIGAICIGLPIFKLVLYIVLN